MPRVAAWVEPARLRLSIMSQDTLTTTPPRYTRTSLYFSKYPAMVSARYRVRSMEDLIHADNPDKILCQETKIDSSVSSAELFPDNCTFFRKDRTLEVLAADFL